MKCRINFINNCRVWYISEFRSVRYDTKVIIIHTEGIEIIVKCLVAISFSFNCQMNDYCYFGRKVHTNARAHRHKWKVQTVPFHNGEWNRFQLICLPFFPFKFKYTRLRVHSFALNQKFIYSLGRCFPRV